MERAARASSRTQLTKLLNAAKEKLSNVDENIEEFNVIRERIFKANETLERANQQVIPTLKEDEYEQEFDKVLDYQDQVAEILSRIQRRIETAGSEQDDNSSVDSGGGSRKSSRKSVSARNSRRTGVSGNGGNQGTSNVKLPKLELRKFKGELSEWTLFWEQFRTTIHENDALDAVSKFNYLEHVLVGKAAATISGLTPSENSYKSAIELLMNEYGNQQRITDSHIQKLLSITPIKSRLDAVGLRNLYNTTASITRNLSAVGIDPMEYGIMVKSVILNCMPYAMKIEFHRSHPNDPNNVVKIADQIDILLNYLKLEVESIEIAQVPQNTNAAGPNPNKEEKRYRHGNNKKDKGFTAAGLTTSVAECLFCKSSSHLTEKCEKDTLSLQQKKETLRKNNRCFRCTKPNHNSRFCRNTITCGKCNYRHVTSMCDPTFKREEKKGKPGTTTSLITKEDGNNNGHVYLQTAKAYIYPSNDSENNAFVRLIIDGGSQLSYIREDVSRKLRLKILGTRRLSVMPFGSEKKSKPQLYNVVELKLISQYNNEPIFMKAISVPEICFDSFQTPNVDHPIINTLEMADISISTAPVTGKISLLIGADYYWKIVTGEFVRLSESLTAVNTKLGWTLQGATTDDLTSVNTAVVSTLHVQVFDEDRDVDMKRFWDLETIGISDKEKQNNFTDSFIESKIALKDDRFEAMLPWINDCAVDSNYNGALARMKSLTFKLSKNARLLEYDQAVRELIDNNIAEKVPSEPSMEKIYYMPHRPVYREDKTTTKIRVVFDASAHAKDFPSLNELLHSGENLVQDLLLVLLNFRVGKIAIVADIEKAFLQIGLANCDRDSHRFLWYESPITDVNNLPPMQEYRMTRVTFGVTSSPFLLSATLKKLFMLESERFQETARRLSNSFYVDDMVSTVNSFKDAIQLYQESKNILKVAGMNLRKWHSNDREFQNYVSESETDANVQTSCPKVLGLFWDTASDKLSLNLASIISFVDGKQSCTKRNVLQAIGRIYDPLYILAPFTIRAKSLLQLIWKANVEWDTELPFPELRAEWTRWCSDLANLTSYDIPRAVAVRDDSRYELHIFSDASQTAYGAVAYIRRISGNRVSVDFLIAKNRVAPIKVNDSSDLSLPRLELTAALCASRLKDYIVKNVNLKFDNTNLWTDSKITLCWVTGDAARWKTYVHNRVIEIQKLTRDSVWRHCSGKINPADLLTRGVRAKELLKSQCWLNGPEFLSRQDSDWTIIDKDFGDILNETQVCAAGADGSDACELKPIFPIDKYEQLEKCFRVTAYVKRVFRKHKSSSTVLSAEELIEAESYWIVLTQKSAFSQEINDLKKRDAVEKSSTIYKLTPFLDNTGILRIRSRLQESELPDETVNPIILPKSSTFVEQLIWKIHKRCHHGGVNLVLAEIRKRFWVVRARQKIKSLLSRCIICKKLRGKPGQESFAPLPRSRILQSQPFENTGVDFAGPLYVYENDEKRKSYIMLLTCAVTRAIHLELVLDLSTESCVRGFRRFIARRGVPAVFHSDNAKTFKRASLELHKLYEMLQSEKISDFTSNQRIKWRFIVERAAWWGGFWERLVKSVKDCLKLALGKSRVSIDELQTMLTEIEATVNSRPLTYIDDDKDSLTALSPSSFLLSGQRQCLLPIVENVKREDVLRQWKERQRVVSKFWTRWSTDYLQQLRTAHTNSWSSPVRKFQVDDIVLLHDQGPRLNWKMVRVTAVYPGRDGKVRACEIRLPSGTHLRRPVQLLYPLEIQDAAREDEENLRNIDQEKPSASEESDDGRAVEQAS